MRVKTLRLLFLGVFVVCLFAFFNVGVAFSESWTFYYSGPSNVKSMTVSSDLWVGSNNAIYIYNKDTKGWRKVKQTDNPVYSLCCSQDKVWAGYGSYVASFDASYNEIARLDTGANVYAVCLSSDNEYVWFTSGDRLASLDIDNPSSLDTAYLSGDTVMAMEAVGDIIFVGTNKYARVYSVDSADAVSTDTVFALENVENVSVKAITGNGAGSVIFGLSNGVVASCDLDANGGIDSSKVTSWDFAESADGVDTIYSLLLAGSSVYLGTNNGVYKLEDASSLGLTGGDIYALAYYGGKIYAASKDAGLVVYSGGSWGPLPIASIRRVVIYGGDCYVAAGNTLYRSGSPILLPLGGPVSTDAGVIIYDVLIRSSSSIYVATNDGVYYYNGTAWSQKASGDTRGLDYSGALYRCTTDKVEKSTDNGSTWQEVGSSSPGGNDILVVSESLIYVASNDGVFKYDGSSWTQSGLDGKIVYRVIKDSQNNIYVAADDGVYVFNGSSWSEVGSLGKAYDVAIVYDGDDTNDTLIAATDNGVYRYVNASLGWQQLDADSMSYGYHVRAVAGSGSTVYYAGTNEGYFYKYTASSFVDISLTPNVSSVSFKTQVNSEDVATFTFTNDGYSNGTVNVAISGDDAEVFSVNKTIVSVPAYGQATFTVTFEPESADTYRATLILTGDFSKEITLVGTATPQGDVASGDEWAGVIDEDETTSNDETVADEAWEEISDDVKSVDKIRGFKVKLELTSGDRMTMKFDRENGVIYIGDNYKLANMYDKDKSEFFIKNRITGKWEPLDDVINEALSYYAQSEETTETVVIEDDGPYDLDTTDNIIKLNFVEVVPEEEPTPTPHTSGGNGGCSVGFNAGMLLLLVPFGMLLLKR